MRWAVPLRAVCGSTLAGWCVALAGLVAVLAGPGVAHGQAYNDPWRRYRAETPVPQGYGLYGISGVDAYGNASNDWRDRRTLGIPNFGAYEGGLRNYGMLEQQSTRRPIYHDVRSAELARTGLGTAESVTNVAWEQQWLLSNVYGTYGGFRQRRPMDSNLQDILSRRDSLLRATALNAPISRELLLSGVATAPGAVLPNPEIEAATLEAMPPEPVPDADAGPPLSEQLSHRLDAAYESTLAEAWGEFSDGRYRIAARLFSGAAQLRRDDNGPRIGETFSLLATQQAAAAAASIRQIINERVTLFAADLNVSDRFSSPDEARRVRLMAERSYTALREAAQKNPSDELRAREADAGAVQVFVLWYLGDRAQARASADALQRNFPDTVYATWPALLRASLGETPTQP